MTIELIRRKCEGKAVRGTLTLPFDESKPFVYPTLENRDFLIPEGRYPLNKTYSPKFKKLLPIVEEVPEREGIRIHQGTRPEHSQGCILVSAEALQNICIFIDKCNYRDYEELYLEIKSGD